MKTTAPPAVVTPDYRAGFEAGREAAARAIRCRRHAVPREECPACVAVARVRSVEVVAR